MQEDTVFYIIKDASLSIFKVYIFVLIFLNALSVSIEVTIFLNLVYAYEVLYYHTDEISRY